MRNGGSPGGRCSPSCSPEQHHGQVCSSTVCLQSSVVLIGHVLGYSHILVQVLHQVGHLIIRIHLELSSTSRESPVAASQVILAAAMAMRRLIPVACALIILMALEVHATSAAVTKPAPSCKIAANALVDCKVYVTGERKIPFKTCCEQVQNILLQPHGNVCLCNALTSAAAKQSGINVTLALSLPQKCVLNSYFKKGQKCAGQTVPGGH